MKFIDSSVWYAYFFDASENAKSIIESNEALFCSILSFFEIKKRAIQVKIHPGQIQKAIEEMNLRAIIVHLNDEIINLAVRVALQNKLGAMDALIYASAMESNTTLVTADNDFRGLSETIVIQK